MRTPDYHIYLNYHNLLLADCGWYPRLCTTPGSASSLAGEWFCGCITGKRAEGSFIEDLDDGTEILWTTRSRSNLEGCLRLLIIWVSSRRVQKTNSNRPAQMAAFRKKSKALIKAKITD